MKYQVGYLDRALMGLFFTVCAPLIFLALLVLHVGSSVTDERWPMEPTAFESFLEDVIDYIKGTFKLFKP